MDGNSVKLRASCDACNDSKVRCSQTKPHCVRCKRKGLLCIYGLSRRSHKDAPRITATASTHSLSLPAVAQQHSDSLQEGTDTISDSVMLENLGACDMANPGELALSPVSLQILPDFNIPSLSASGGPETSRFPLFPGDLAGNQQETNGGMDILFSLDQLDAVSGSQITRNRSSSSRLSRGERARRGSAETSPSRGRDTAQLQSRPQSGINQLKRPHTLITTPPLLSHGEQKGLQQTQCSCESRTIPTLAFMYRSRSLIGKRDSFDVELSQLKGAMDACTTSMRCQKHSCDPTNIIIAAVIIGCIIDGFEMLPAEKDFSRTSSDESRLLPSPSISTAWGPSAIDGSRGQHKRRSSTMSDDLLPETAASTSKASWGVLELDDDDEVEIQRRLSVLYFRRLEGLLDQFHDSVRMLRDSQSRAEPDCSTYVMACEYLRMWLDQKAKRVKESLHSTQNEATTIDSWS